MAKESQNLRIDHAEDDINYYNGFRNAVKLLNTSLQYLNKALDEVPDKYLRDTLRSWGRNTFEDMNGFEHKMYSDLKNVYGMALRIGPNDSYYIKLADREEN